MHIRRARDDGRLDRELSQIGKAELLVMDELGFLPLDADGARLLFQVVSEAYERQSVVFTTNLEFSRWGAVFGDDQMAAAVTGRVVHHGRLLQFKGEPYRVRHALMQ
jgi:DNA replication protein DnaC